MFRLMRVSFSECTICSSKPRITFPSSYGKSSEEDYKELSQGLEELDFREKLYGIYYKCNECGTYYRMVSMDSKRLVRITHIEVRLVFQKGKRDKSRLGEEFHYIKEHYSRLMKEIQKALKSPNELAREFAGETKADQYKHLHRNEKVRELLKHPDKAVRKGVLWSFIETPKYNYNLSRPSLRLIESLDKKPFVRGDVFLRSLTMQLLDFDSEFRSFACSLLQYLKWNNKFLPLIAKIPESKRTPELYECIMERIYDLPLLTKYLSHPEKEIREITLRRVFELCDNEDTIQGMKTELQNFKGIKSEEMLYFLANPNLGISEYDPYD